MPTQLTPIVLHATHDIIRMHVPSIYDHVNSVFCSYAYRHLHQSLSDATVWRYLNQEGIPAPLIHHYYDAENVRCPHTLRADLHHYLEIIFSPNLRISELYYRLLELINEFPSADRSRLIPSMICPDIDHAADLWASILWYAILFDRDMRYRNCA